MNEVNAIPTNAPLRRCGAQVHRKFLLYGVFLILMSLVLPSGAGSEFPLPGPASSVGSERGISSTSASETDGIDPALAAAMDPTQFDQLLSNVKILDASAILEDFQKGASETAVIVTLRPTATADALAAESRLSVQIPDEFNRTGAPAFYDLRNLDIRNQLRETVTQEVEWVIRQLSVPGLTVTQRFSYQFGFAARVTADALELIVQHPAVIRIEKDWELEPHLRQGIPLMDAETPRLSYDGSGISIAICDTGIDTSHPRLGGGGQPIFNAKVIGGYDTGDNDPDPRPNPTLGNAHGTAVAGISAGNLGTVGDYIGGVAPGSKLYALKISTGTGGSATTGAMIAGWEWPITHQHDDPTNPIMIINTSFGGGRYFGACDSAVPAMTTAAANAVAAGITIFVSSGNDGYCDSMGWPACISYVSSVGAVYDANIGQPGWCVNAASCAVKQPYPQCSTGYAAFEASTAADQVTVYSNSASFLTLFAPSNHAYTTDIVGSGGYSTGDYAPTFGGTSAASPYAAGAAAVLQSAAKANIGRYLTPSEVRQYLTTNGDSITDGKVVITKPRINLARAVAALPGGSTYTLTVNSSGASGVAITADPSAYGGTTNYSLTGIASGASITLTAPATSGTANFSSWSGCASTSNRDCTVAMTQDRTVTVNYSSSGLTLGEALDNPTLTWTTGGSAYWYPQTEQWHFGGSAAASGTITHNQNSWIETTVTGPGTLRYHWRVSSESGWDFLSFYLNGALQAGRISGEVDWTLREHSLPTGTHTLRWEYAKDGSVSSGSDRGWLDRVIFESSETYTLNVNSSGAAGVAITANPSAYGGVTNYSHAGIASGASITLTAPAIAGGANFSSWSGCGSTAGTSCTVAMTQNQTATVSYTSSDPCPELVLANRMVTGPETHESCRITAGPAFVVTATGNVTLRAGQEITLGSGVAVQAGGLLQTQFDPDLKP